LAAFGHVDVGTREECRLKQGDGFLGPSSNGARERNRVAYLSAALAHDRAAECTTELRRIKSATSLHI
jgi:hypothetical protein